MQGSRISVGYIVGVEHGPRIERPLTMIKAERFTLSESENIHVALTRAKNQSVVDF